MGKPVVGLGQYKDLIEAMEKSGSSYLKGQASALDRYVTQLVNEEISRTEFKILIQDIIEFNKIDYSDNYASKDRIRKIMLSAKELIPNFTFPFGKF